MKTRRRFLGEIGALGVASASPFLAGKEPSLKGKMGIVTASFGAHFNQAETGLTLLTLPKLMRDELGLEVVDFNSANFESFQPAYLEALRSAVSDAGCIATNLKMNQVVDMNSPDPETRAEAMRVYKTSIDAARTLGLRWVRPLPRSEIPDMDLHVSAYRELIDYAGERGITVLIENFGWMMSDPDSIVTLKELIGGDDVAVGLDTGNWSDNEVRYPALRKSFPLAVTCDFKAKTMREDGSHPAYDLKKCFEIGRESGFEGPWCFEHANRDWKSMLKEIRFLRESLQGWMKEKQEA